MPIVTQSRDLPMPYVEGSYKETAVNGSNIVVSCNNDRGVGRHKGTQLTTSYRGNSYRDWSNLSGRDLQRSMKNAHKSTYDTGHPFYSWKLEFDYPLKLAEISTRYKSGSVQSGQYSLKYRGPLHPTWTTTARPADVGLGDSALDALGRQAIAATIPTAPEAGLTSMLVEMREGLPKLVGATLAATAAKRNNLNKVKETGKAIGSEYLNVEFGYKPLANDIAKLAVAVIDFQKNIEKAEKGSGEITRRGAKLDTERSNVLIPFTNEPPGILMPRGNSSNKEDQFFGTTSTATVELHKSLTRDVWFAGAYTYYLSAGDNLVQKMKRYSQLAEMLLGGTLTPEVVWQVTPWSWLIDWFSDMDVFMTNVTALRDDSNVLRYAYIMCETHEVWTKRVSGINPRATSSFPTYLQSSWSRTTKQRRQATPYGFGLDLNSLSNRRWSILGALGMTRAPGHLRG